jgi:hypothetical protein
MSVAYVLSLRGSEGLLLDLKGLRTHHSKGGREGNKDYFIIALLGSVQGEQHGRCHLFSCVETTLSSIPIKAWVEVLIDNKEVAGITDGPAILDLNGKVRTPIKLDG